MNRLDLLFQQKKQAVLSVYFTAGFPGLNDTVEILQELELAGVDLVEIGIPFSDPLADGPVIQQSSTLALENGMSLSVLFEQLKNVREKINIPLVLMGYLNPVMQFGFDKFCQKAAECGIDGVILPDLPPEIFETQYKTIFDAHHLHPIMLITPRTSPERARYIDSLSRGFVYAVSSSATTGKIESDTLKQQEYFETIPQLKLKNPVLIGFGISNREKFNHACLYASGAVVGTAFIRKLAEKEGGLKEKISAFVRTIR